MDVPRSSKEKRGVPVTVWESSSAAERRMEVILLALRLVL